MTAKTSGGGRSASGASETTSLLSNHLTAARQYSTFLLGMADHDPPAVVIPSKGKARLLSSHEQIRAQEERENQDQDSIGSSEDEEDAQERRRRQGGSTVQKQQNQVQQKPSSASKWTTLGGYIKSHDLYLDNVGSVARDHLANERTFLAWLRTSLSLASIGVAITQLFRLSSSSYTLPSQPDSSSISPGSSATTSTSSALPSIASSDLTQVVSSLLYTVQQQQKDIISLGLSVSSERGRYKKLGKPIGGTFLILGIFFMVLGAHRYLSVQHHLSTRNHFPPARRSVLISSMLVMALLIAAFASILAIH